MKETGNFATINENIGDEYMKKMVFISMLLGVVSVNSYAQDDMYFTPKKSNKQVRQTVKAEDDGNDRDVDEYNRRRQFVSSYDVIDGDSTMIDVIDFSAGSYGDTLDVDDMYNPEDDYAYSRRMSRFDDYYWRDPWYYSWYDPWWYGSPYWYGSPWWYGRYGWYDPWYYSWYSPWSPWCWHYPVYYHAHVGHPSYGGGRGMYRGYNTRGTNYAHNDVWRSNSSRNGYNNRGNSASTRRNSSDSWRNNTAARQSSRNNRHNNDFNTTNVNRQSFNSGSSFGGSRGSGSFGGSRGGGSFGGSRGGGSFGGRR